MSIFEIREPRDFEVGDRIGASATFTRTDNGALIDADTVTAKVRKPDGTVDDYEAADVEHMSTGLYLILIDIDMAGRWRYSFYGTGAVKAAGDSFFDVSPSEAWEEDD